MMTAYLNPADAAVMSVLGVALLLVIVTLVVAVNRPRRRGEEEGDYKF